MVKLVGRRTGVVVDTDDLAQDGAFDGGDLFVILLDQGDLGLGGLAITQTFDRND